MEGWSGGAARDHHLIARPNEYTAGAAHTAGCDTIVTSCTSIYINNIQGQCILARFPCWKHHLALSHFMSISIVPFQLETPSFVFRTELFES